ncbi:DUF167 domain-containing protein [Patescibacteria group bacterium]|nr:DUF167 domain-containing protein [Patescibacteria group bacterium]
MKISVRVTTRAKREGVETLAGGRLHVSVKAKAEGGAANARALGLVAGYFKISPKKIHIIRGHKTPAKILEVGSR